MAADRHGTARTSLAATEAIRAARPTTGKPPPSAVVRQASCQAFPGRTGDRPSRGGAWGTGRRTPSEGPLLTPVRPGGGGAPQPVSPAAQAGREAAQV